jgi:glycosyltransferase involved in cell wall biosynthesis
MRLDLVVPCFNEAEVLEQTAGRLRAVLAELQAKGKIAPGSGVCFVDDGSTDGTWRVIDALAERHGSVRGIKLSRNRGHQNALVAGLFSSSADAVVTLDADL